MEKEILFTMTNMVVFFHWWFGTDLETPCLMGPA
jgi:hypothetical protein